MYQQALILGLGNSGLAMAIWLTRQGTRVRVADTRAAPPQLSALQQACPEVMFTAGTFTTDWLDGCDVLALSPGLSLHDKTVAPLLEYARAQHIAVVGEIELFAQGLAQLRETQGYAPKILAITGTNGKTTTTQLTGLLCARSGHTVGIAGNIGAVALDVFTQAIAENALPEIWVLELSSFQLATTHSLCPEAATVLNLSVDHLDWHLDLADYITAKTRIFSPRTIRILNADDAYSAAMQHDDSVRWFGGQVPTHPYSYGVQHEGALDWLVEAWPVDAENTAAPKPRKEKTRKTATPQAFSVQKLMPVNALKIRGRHNVSNALAALALCRAIDLPLAPLLHGLREYLGEPHRVQHLTTLNGVDYFDDSKGTNVGATVAALESVGEAKKVLLIAGGDGKGQDFLPLIEAVQNYARAVLLIGRDAEQIFSALAATEIALENCGADDQALQRAVRRAAQLAQPGDAVLLSPACASFDMFRNYEHRADVFATAVQTLREEGGLC